MLLAPMQPTPVPLGPDDAVGFDYETAELTEKQVIRFERRAQIGATVYDWSSLGMPPVVAGAPTGWQTYRYAATYWPFDVAVTVWFRACTVAICGAPSEAATFIKPTTTVLAPVAPVQVRRIGPG